MPELGMLKLLALTALFGVACGFVATATWWRVRRESIRRLAPVARLGRLLFWAGLPVLTGIGLVAVGLLPSVLDSLGLLSDHCHAHPDHHVHLCFVHATHSHSSLLGWFPVGLFAIWFAARAATGLADTIRGRRRVRRLCETAEYDDDAGVWMLATDVPLAVTVGLVRPEILVSRRLREELPDEDWRVIEAHERSHARRRHGLLGLAVRVLTILHPEPVRDFLRREFAVACEQIADEDAADEIGDSVEVAETILAVERLFDIPDERSALEPAFGGSEIERRVEGLLDDRWRRPSPAGAVALGVLGLLGIIMGYDAVHHGVETLLAFVI